MPSVLAIMAHPDDIEFTCAGTLALLKQTGWHIHMATMTPGDLGSMKLSRTEIANVRRAEAATSAAILEAPYHCLEFDDLTIVYGEQAKRRVCALIRRVRPEVIVTHAPSDYMADHEETARIAREAAFASTMPNWKTEPQEAPCDQLPVILHADPIEHTDSRGQRLPARQVVNITNVIETKERMLAAHESQRSWLREQHGEDEYLLSMRRWSADRARDFKRRSVRYAEGFNQHVGHAYPKHDLLTQALGKTLVKTFR